MNRIEELITRETPKLLNCVHCGLCLEQCPTYRLTGDESNSPRGRLAIWRAINEDRLAVDEHTDFYTAECVGCLACETVCPAGVPYGELLYETRHRRVAAGARVRPAIRMAGWLVQHPRLMSALLTPLRALRRIGLRPHRFIFPGAPAVLESTAAYARRLMAAHSPDGPPVALFTGCLMESAFREINHATVRVLVANNCRVTVPEGQTCCGAVLEHEGLPGKAGLDARNRAAFADGPCVVTNAAGCGLALGHAIDTPARDLTSFLNELDLVPGSPLAVEHLYFDIPCHLYHGQGVRTPPEKIFSAIGNAWSLAPNADRCCGSGGAYNVTHPENAGAMLREKSAFLDDDSHDRCMLVTANHVCMMQWQTAVAKRPRCVGVRHIVQVLDESYQRAGVYTS
jgi:glycolate oxidase iron-sulfur subunit